MWQLQHNCDCLLSQAEQINYLQKEEVQDVLQCEYLRGEQSPLFGASGSGAHYALCALGVGLIALGIVMIVWTVIPVDGEKTSTSTTTTATNTTVPVDEERKMSMGRRTLRPSPWCWWVWAPPCCSCPSVWE
ncbi:hypothetical protein WMY93_011677 [Mugilogobius chulae]|uniref:Uncharacterized protein n=1 Tax=Mugilogobius chulae TaxID=88201 RepID=A0AAW0PEF7_9GOBI